MSCDAEVLVSDAAFSSCTERFLFPGVAVTFDSGRGSPFVAVTGVVFLDSSTLMVAKSRRGGGRQDFLRRGPLPTRRGVDIPQISKKTGGRDLQGIVRLGNSVLWEDLGFVQKYCSTGLDAKLDTGSRKDEIAIVTTRSDG